MRPLLQIQWPFLAFGLAVGLIMIWRGARELKKQRQMEAPPEVKTQSLKTLKEKRNAWYTAEVRFGYRFLVNGLALTLGCLFLAWMKLKGG